MTLADIFRQEGMQKGKTHGESTMLLGLLERKFGHIPTQYCALISKADEQQLLRWSYAVLEANSIEDVFESRH